MEQFLAPFRLDSARRESRSGEMSTEKFRIPPGGLAPEASVLEFIIHRRASQSGASGRV